MSHEVVRPKLSPLEQGQLWEVTSRSSSADLRSFDVADRNPMIRFDFFYVGKHPLWLKSTDEEFRDRGAKRRLVNRAIALGFEDDAEYKFALETANNLSHVSDELSYEEGGLAVRSIYRELVTRRSRSFEDQAMKLNEYIRDDPQNLTVLLTRRTDNPETPPYAFANLEGFYVADRGSETGPKPGLLLSGYDGRLGKVPASYSPFGLYIEYSQEQADAEAAARQRVVKTSR